MLPDSLKLITELSSELKDVKTRVERLETLEFQNIVDNAGCVVWEDNDSGLKATYTVSMPAPTGSTFPYTHATIFWHLRSNDAAATVDLFMRIDASVANYHYAYKYTKGGALTQVGLDSQSEWFVGRIGGFNEPLAYGHITVPFHGILASHSAFGDWTHYEPTAGANATMEKGEWGGTNRDGVPSHITDFNFFASAGNISGRVYLYGWCPRDTPSGPID